MTNFGNYAKQRTIATFSNLQSFKTSLQFLRNRPQYIHGRRTRITNAQVIYHKTNINNPYPKWTKIPPTYLFGTSKKKRNKNSISWKHKLFPTKNTSEDISSGVFRMYNMFIMLLPEHRKILKVSNTGQQGYMANNFWNIFIIWSFFMYSLWASDTLKVGSSTQEWMNDWLAGWFEWNGKKFKILPTIWASETRQFRSQW